MEGQAEEGKLSQGTGETKAVTLPAELRRHSVGFLDQRADICLPRRAVSHILANS